MAYTTKAVHLEHSGIRRQLDHFFASIGQGFNSYLEAHAHAAEIEKLSAKSDKELAELGISRDQIVRYVFRGQYYG